jgi:hypothetical protein
MRNRLGYYDPSILRLSNEEKFTLADVAACKIEQERGSKMTPKEYEDFVINYTFTIAKPEHS